MVNRSCSAPPPPALMAIWAAILEDVAAQWQRAAGAARRLGGDGPWMPWSLEAPLLEEVRGALLCGGEQDVRRAVGAWRAAWLEYLADGVPHNPTVLGMLDAARERFEGRGSNGFKDHPAPAAPAGGNGKSSAPSKEDPMKVGRFVSSYLKAEDLPRPVSIVIERCEPEVLEHDGKQEEKLILYAKGATRGIALSKAGIIQLTEILASDDTDDWAGKRVIVFNDTSVQFAGRRVGGIRFRAVDGAARPSAPAAAPARAAPEPPKEAAPPPAEAGDWPPAAGDIPF